MSENISSKKEKKQGGNETSATKITTKSSLCNPFSVLSNCTSFL